MILLLEFLQEVLLEILLLEYLISLKILLGNLAWWLEFLLLFLEFDWNLTAILYGTKAARN